MLWYYPMIVNPKNRISPKTVGMGEPGGFTKGRELLYLKAGYMICLTHRIDDAPWFFGITNKIHLI